MSDSSKSALSLISTHKGYSESEQRIVDYILEHQSEAPCLTAAQLCLLYTSDAADDSNRV